MKTAAIYARVSSDKQREENTIASQTAALVAFAGEQQFEVPRQWIFEDDGYSGASLIRPGLERVRDLAAEGLIQALLIYAPDRLSRRYAHQILLIEELARAGAETVFMRAPRGSTPEDELLLQFQGMIAEYERAQILERSRRGKRHRARQGEVSVLSGAPFGYRFVRKTEHPAAYYEIDEEQARVVCQIFELYGVQGLSIGAIARLMNEQAVRPASDVAAGSVRRCGACCAIWRTKVRRVSVRRRWRRASASRGRSGCAVAWPLVTAPVTNERERIGSRLRCRRLSARRPSHLPRSDSRPTRFTRRGAP
jgi:site-specific DNA recombinase